MPIIGVLTNDFRAYYEIVKALKDRSVPFTSLSFDESVPPHVGVVITTDLEAIKIDFPRLVVYENARQAVEDAQQALLGKRTCRELIIGVDPGEHPGIAVLCDGKLVRAHRASSPVTVKDEVERIVDKTWARSYVVRVGHGAKTARDTIINALLSLGHAVEVVDETRTSPPRYKTAEERDVEAARAIALTTGRRVHARRRLSPTAGEVRDIQRKSRIASGGEVTIATKLARDVAVGALTMEEAIERQTAAKRGTTGDVQPKKKEGEAGRRSAAGES